jgi:hypothetical protein
MVFTSFEVGALPAFSIPTSDSSHFSNAASEDLLMEVNLLLASVGIVAKKVVSISELTRVRNGKCTTIYSHSS